MSQARALDLVVLVPGADERETLDALLARRHESLAIRPLRYRILKHPRRDPGCFHEAPDLLRLYQRTARHALVVLDHEGSGQEGRPVDAVTADLRARLADSGWGQRAEAVVIAPELEIWVWSLSPHLAATFGWPGDTAALRRWLGEHGLWPHGKSKPSRPKEALEAVLRQTRRRRSAAIYGQLAQRVGLQRCADPAFERLVTTLRRWFPVER